jgi:hypothetical protein
MYRGQEIANPMLTCLTVSLKSDSSVVLSIVTGDHRVNGLCHLYLGTTQTQLLSIDELCIAAVLSQHRCMSWPGTLASAHGQPRRP